MTLIFFFFKQKTAYEMRISDWSSDVCSSDLIQITICVLRNGEGRRQRDKHPRQLLDAGHHLLLQLCCRSLLVALRVHTKKHKMAQYLQHIGMLDLTDRKSVV